MNSHIHRYTINKEIVHRHIHKLYTQIHIHTHTVSLMHIDKSRIAKNSRCSYLQNIFYTGSMKFQRNTYVLLNHELNYIHKGGHFLQYNSFSYAIQYCHIIALYAWHFLIFFSTTYYHWYPVMSFSISLFSPLVRAL